MYKYIISKCRLGLLLWYIFTYDHNKFGVAVAMNISKMHEKSCIDSHNARKFEKKIQNSVIHTSRNHNDAIAKV